ncbi:MAG: NAD(P)-dependent oxidoreductase, partial [Gemmobacter sp.]
MRAGTAATARVGWIGAGKMGAPMVRNLLAQGTAVAVTDVSAAAVAALVAAGATAAPCPADHAASDIVFSMLPDDDALLGVALGQGPDPGLDTVLRAGAILVEMSTVSPSASARVAQALEGTGISYLRAPVSGSTALAEKAALTILGSGPEAAWQTALPYLSMLSNRRIHLGPGDEARYMKLVVNTLIGATSAVLAEALTLGAAGGLTREAMMDVILESAAASPLLRYKREAVVAGDYAPAFTVDQMIKDFSLLSDAARARRVPLFVNGLILDLYRAAANSGLSEADFFALVK